MLWKFKIVILYWHTKIPPQLILICLISLHFPHRMHRHIHNSIIFHFLTASKLIWQLHVTPINYFLIQACIYTHKHSHLYFDLNFFFTFSNVASTLSIHLLEWNKSNSSYKIFYFLKDSSNSKFISPHLDYIQVRILLYL